MVIRTILAGIILVGLFSQHRCSRYRPNVMIEHTENIPSTSNIHAGLWKFNLLLGKESLPFFCRYSHTDSSFTIINATEKITCKPVVFKGDSLFFSTPVFDNVFCLKKTDHGHLTGIWRNLGKGKNYFIPVDARSTTEKPAVEVLPLTSGQKWEVNFGTGSGSYKAIGLFNYFEPQTITNVMTVSPVSGTFLTETGDYRFLEGQLVNNTITLSCFDGSHAFLFKAEFNEQRDSVKGTFYSGNHYQENWIGWRNDNVQLKNPDSITLLKKEYKSIAFTFPDLNGKMVSYPSAKFNNKVTIVEIMGSWCPNCMDETLYMDQLKTRYGPKGLEIIALCFERTDDFKKAVASVKKMQETLNANYEFLIAGTSNKEMAGKALPMLNGIYSFPTTIFIDKKGVVRKIYTGFYGPSTGSYYQHYTEQTENFLQKLMME